jgi:anti-sigma factor RsiW
MRIQTRSEARILKKGQNVADAELTCKELTELITDYLEERLPETERIRFEQHLSICPGCVTYLEQMRFTIKALGAKLSGKIPEAVESDLLQTFRSWKNSR